MTTTIPVHVHLWDNSVPLVGAFVVVVVFVVTVLVVSWSAAKKIVRSVGHLGTTNRDEKDTLTHDTLWLIYI